jgi:type II secretory pathway pseudopilin PulG
MHSPLRSQNGFTYIGALFLVVVMGILLSAAGQSWQTIMKGEMEAELLFRGAQYRSAIERWSKGNPPAIPANRPLSDLKDLLQDPRSLQKARYLRKLYTDPVTGKDFVPVKDQALGIIGVVSASDEKPLKKDWFSPEFVDLVGKEKYSEWKFVYDRTKATVSTAPGTASQTTTATGTTGTSPAGAGVPEGLGPPPTRPSIP